MFPTMFRVYWLSVQVKKRKIDFQESSHGGHLDFRPSFVNWPFVSGEEAKKNRYLGWMPSWMLDQMYSLGAHAIL